MSDWISVLDREPPKDIILLCGNKHTQGEFYFIGKLSSSTINNGCMLFCMVSPYGEHVPANHYKFIEKIPART